MCGTQILFQTMLAAAAGLVGQRVRTRGVSAFLGLGWKISPAARTWGIEVSQSLPPLTPIFPSPLRLRYPGRPFGRVPHEEQAPCTAVTPIEDRRSRCRNIQKVLGTYRQSRRISGGFFIGCSSRRCLGCVRPVLRLFRHMAAHYQHRHDRSDVPDGFCDPEFTEPGYQNCGAQAGRVAASERGRSHRALRPRRYVRG